MRIAPELRRRPRAFSLRAALSVGVLVLAGEARADAQVVINEIQASNARTISDDEGRSSDWVELFNAGSTAVDLSGYGLSDDPNELKKWVLPEVVLGPGQYQLIWCSGRNRPAAGGATASADPDDAPGSRPRLMMTPVRTGPGSLHTGFKLASSGESVVLSDASGRILDRVDYPRLSADHSYGRAPDGRGAFLFHRKPTPNAKNAGKTSPEPLVVADTKFSHKRGFYQAPVTVAITTETRGATIRFTTDGSEPTPARGIVYQKPIRIDHTTVLRAIAYRDGLVSTDVDTHTYIFPGDIAHQTVDTALTEGFPPFWGDTRADYGLDPKVVGPDGRDLFGGKYRHALSDSLRSLPTVSVTANVEDLFGQHGIYARSKARGFVWERTASTELLFPDGQKGFQSNASIRVHGGAFRSHDLTRKHSLRLVFNGIQGPTKLKYGVFGKKNGAAKKFDTLTLKACSNDGWQWSRGGSQPVYLRDAFARRTALDMGAAAPHSRFVHLYINGLYWGVYQLTERPDSSYASTYFGGEKDEWDTVSNGDAEEGDLAAWRAMLQRASRGLKSNAAYFAIQGRNADGTDNPKRAPLLDVDSFIDYLLTNFYIGNVDWPAHNYWAARNRKHPSGFRFFMWDSEWSLGLDSPIDADRTTVKGGAAIPYAAARGNGEFRMRFADHVHRHFFNGGALYVDPEHPEWDPAHPERNIPAARFEALAKEIETAMVAESARWGDQHEAAPYTRDEHWEVERRRLLRFYFPQRSAIVMRQIRDAGLYPSTEAPSFQQHGGKIEPGFAALIRAPRGTIHYTTDGTDPRRVGGSASRLAVAVPATQRALPLPPRKSARYSIDTTGLDAKTWNGLDFDDSRWRTGRVALAKSPSSPRDTSPAECRSACSLYLRAPFLIGGNDDPAELVIYLRHDDPYAVYLNGQLVLLRERAGHGDRSVSYFERFVVPMSPTLLRPGINILAIEDRAPRHDRNGQPVLPRIEASGVRVVMNRSTVLRARARAYGVWSAVNEASFEIEEPLSRL